MAEIKIKSVLPIYLTGVAWAGYAALFPLYRWYDFVAPALISGLVYLTGSKLIPPKVVTVSDPPRTIRTGDADADQVLTEGRKYMEAFDRLAREISNQRLSAEVNQLKQLAGEIFDYIERNPHKLRQIKQFNNYYLPTTVKLLTNYRDLDHQATKGENIQSAMKGIEGMMETVLASFRHVLDDLFAGQSLDITVDIEVLEKMMQREGLEDGRQ